MNNALAYSSVFLFIVIGSSKTNDNEKVHKNLNVDNSCDVVAISKC